MFTRQAALSRPAKQLNRNVDTHRNAISRPRSRNRLGRPQPVADHSRHIGNCSGTPLPVCCHRGGIQSKSTEPASTVRIRRVRPSACLKDHTLESGEVGPVVFDHLSTWWLITEGADFLFWNLLVF